jgi:hypothetical protein
MPKDVDTARLAFFSPVVSIDLVNEANSEQHVDTQE